MTQTRTTLALAIALASTLGLSACNRDRGTPTETTPPPASAPTAPAPATPAEQPPAAPSVQVTEIVLGTQASDSERVADPKTDFAPTDRTIIASVITQASADHSGELRARWTFQDGQLVEESSQRLDFSGPGVTNFRINNTENWPVGKYRIEVSLDGNVVQTREFNVVQ